MAYDFLSLAASLLEIKEQALGAKINKIHQPDKTSILLRYYGHHGQGRILLSAAAEQARIQLTELNPENPAKPPLFSMVLRKWLEGATLKQVEQTPYERVAQLTFATRNEVGDPVSLRLIIEIMGKHSNIILVDEAGQILDGIRRYDSHLSRYREVLPGVPYLPPPPQERSQPPLTEEQLAALLLEQELDTLLERALSRSVAGISPQLARDIMLGAGLDPLATLDALGELEFSRLAQQINALSQHYAAGEFQPTLLYRQGQPAEFAALPLNAWQGEDTRPAASMGTALDIFYGAKQTAQRFANHKRHLEKALNQHLTRLRKKISLQRDDLAASLRGDRYKAAGDLLAAHLYQVQQLAGSSGRGLTEVSLPSFENPQEQITLELDAALTPQQNVQRYYRLYNKCRKAHEAIIRYLQENEEELAYLESVSQSLANTATEMELQEIERELKSGHYLATPPPAKGKSKKVEKSAPAQLPPRRYLSQDGFLILVGRNNKQNDRLTFRQAEPHDLWLHSQKIPGSHVIIVTAGKPLPDTTLTEAAAYAAWFSQAQASSKVPVDYTLVSQVKKPQGARPGMVNYFQQQTVYVEPRNPGPELAEQEQPTE